MASSGIDDGFGDAIDNLVTSIDLESRGCQLVSPSRGLGSDTDHVTVLNKLKTLLESPGAATPASVIRTDSGKYLQYKDVVSSELPDIQYKLDKAGMRNNGTRLAEDKDAKNGSPMASNMSSVSDNSCGSLKRTERENILMHAEAVIEYQRERINSLEAAIDKFNTTINKTNSLYKQELQRLGEENLGLRQELQKTVTEFEVLSKRYSLDLSEADNTKRKLNVINHDMAKKDLDIERLKEKLEHLPKENEQLKEKNILLSNEIERLNREIKGLNLIEMRKPVKATVAEISTSTKACAAQNDKLKASSKCIANLENDLEGYKRLTESQSIEIRRLQYKLEKLRTASRPADYMGTAQKQMLQIRSVFTQLAKQCNEPKKETTDTSVEEEIKNRSLYAAYNLRTSVEFREMYDKLLEVVNRNISKNTNEEGFYCMVVNYRCDQMNEELKLRVDESVLTFYRVEEDSLPEIKITLNSVAGVKRLEENNEFCIQTSDGSKHTIALDNKDSYTRLYYALQYAGFITEHVRFSIFTKVDYNWIPESFSWPSFTAVVRAAECTYNGEAPMDYKDVSRLMSEVYVITDPAERLITIENSTNCLVVLGPQLSSTPFIVYCESVLAVRLCQHDHEDCEKFEGLAPPIATLANGAPTGKYFSPTKHTFAFVLPNNRILFVNAVDTDNEKRFLKIVHKGNYKVPQTRKEQMRMEPMKKEISHGETLQLIPIHSVDPVQLVPTVSIELKSNASMDQMSEPENSRVFEFLGNALLLYLKGQDPIKISNMNGRFRINEEKKEVAVSSGSSETYVLSFATMERLSDFEKNLISNGFNVDADADQHKQVCIVSFGCLQLYKNSNAEPIITFKKDETNVTIKEEQREIQIAQFSGKMVKMTLDCTNHAEFHRWKFALSFAGFIKSAMKIKPSDAVRQFIFPIKIFDTDPNDERRAFEVEQSRICMYVNPTTKDPFLIFEKSSVTLELFDNERRLRIYVNRNSRMEERFDFVLAMLSDYDALKTALKTNMYRLDTAKKPKSSRYHFVLSKPGMITVHRTKYDAEPQLVLDRKYYTATVSNLRIQFNSKMDSGGIITMAFAKDFNFRRWLMALKVAGFLPLTNERVPILYMPTIIYGHNCVDVPTLLKGHLK